MKKIMIILVLLTLLVGGLFVWLLMGAGPANAPQDVRTIELPDTYEK